MTQKYNTIQNYTINLSGSRLDFNNLAGFFKKRGEKMRKDVERKKLNLIKEVQREAQKVHILNGKKEIKIIKIDKDELKE